MKNEMILGVDMGGTNVRAGMVQRGTVNNLTSKRLNARGTAGEVLLELFTLTDQLMEPAIKAIGIGFPGLATNGVAYDVYNIPSWKKIELTQLMQERYHLPVLINNDANCFAIGEFYFGGGQGADDMIGLTIGTGLGAGIIINKKLHPGKTGGAGEFGMISYLDKFYEYYACGQFFSNVYGIDGESVFKLATAGDAKAIEMYNEMGHHLGNAIKMMLYALDIDLIVLGGSVRKAYSLFSTAMWKQINSTAFKRGAAALQIKISALENSGILGAAALHYNL